jgi:hypothetical protein
MGKGVDILEDFTAETPNRAADTRGPVIETRSVTRRGLFGGGADNAVTLATTDPLYRRLGACTSLGL